MINYFFSQEDTQKALDALDPQVIRAFSAVNIAKKLADIGTRHNIHIDQLTIVEAQLTYLLSGLINSSQFTERLQNLLSTDSSKIQILMEDINQTIIKPIQSRILVPENEDIPEDDDIETSIPETNGGLPEEMPVKLQKQTSEIPINNVVEQKLSTFIQSKKVISDQSIQKISPKDTEKKIDPYREPIS